MERRSGSAGPVMRLIWAAAALCALSADPAMAHGGELPIGPGDLWHHWGLDPWVWVPLLLAHWIYGRGVLRLWRRAGWGRGISLTRASAFIGGEVILVVALISPLDPLGETLFSAHMAQHTLLVAIAPPLLLAGLPGAAFSWALPHGFRRAAARSSGLRSMARGVSWLLHPLPAATLHALTIWTWHAPSLFDAALGNTALHTLEHILFFGTGLLFWQSLIVSMRSRARLAAGVAAGFLTLLQGGFLSALITFAPQPLYTWYLDRAAAWGVSALEDQQLAGLLMGVPMGMVYLFACLAIAARFLVPAESAYEFGRGTDVNESHLRQA